MSLFGGLDLGTPASRNEMALKRELELRRTREPYSGWGKVYRTGADLLLQHGRFYQGRRQPEEYKHLAGPMNECYWTSLAACEADPSLRYVEGVVSNGVGSFVSHGWCVAPDGGIVDLTYPDEMAEGGLDYNTRLPILPHEHWGYWGVILQPELVRTQEEMPMLGRDKASEHVARVDAEGRWFTKGSLEVTPPAALPLLDVPYDPNRKEF